MCVFHSSQFTFMTRNQGAQPPNIIVDTKSGETLRQIWCWSVKYIITLIWSAATCRRFGTR